MKRKDSGPLVVGGELMLELLNTISLDTLLRIEHELGQPDFTNQQLVQTVRAMYESRRRRKMMEECETIADTIYDDSYDGF